MQNVLMETLKAAITVLDDEGVTYAVTGSVASSVHGEVYVSEDVDLILNATPQKATAIANKLSPRFYAPQDMLSAAARDFSFANAIDNRTGLKVDLSFVPVSGFFGQVLGRRVQTTIGSDQTLVQMVTGEDIILMKLLWRKDTKSQKQWDNALGVVRVQGVSLDWKYLFEQAKALGLTRDLTALRDEGGV